MYLINFFDIFSKMPYLRSPPRIRRMMQRRTTILRRYNSAARMSRVLRSIGAPALAHTFARPGQRITIHTANNTFTTSDPTTILGAMSPASGIWNTQSFSFSQFFNFASVQNSSDLSAMYDNYRIKMVKLRIDLSFDTVGSVAPSANLGNSSFGSLPLVHYCIDPDDNQVPGAVGDVLQYTKSRSVRLGTQPIYINFVPRAQNAIIANPVNDASPGTPAAGGMLPAGSWLDTKSGGVPHYGVKFFVENMPTCALDTNVPTQNKPNWLLYITPVYILEMKTVH